MIPTPSSSPRVVFTPRTNTLHSRRVSHLPTPQSEIKQKKRLLNGSENSVPSKRAKISQLLLEPQSESESSDSEFEEYTKAEDEKVAHARAHNLTTFRMNSRFLTCPATRFKKPAPSTLPILHSFVTSKKSDVFRCQSVGEDNYLTPPYACSYSRIGKNGGIPLLAVATEQGTLHILNTSKRNDWDFEPPRTSFQPHNNGIFDVKWSIDDTHLATCSGDQSTRISCAKTGSITHVLRGHCSTVRCMAWDPRNNSLLATGGRDGSICLWDLRVGERYSDGEMISGSPVITIHNAHDNKKLNKSKKTKQTTAPRSVTNILYPESQPQGIVSSGSFDGILRSWDVRNPTSPKKRKSEKTATPRELYSSLVDPTLLHGSRRSRGIISLASGIGPSAGLMFAIGADSRVHIYDFPSLTAQSRSFSHENLQASSFYLGVSVSPCGRWLACGGSGNRRSSFIFDVENAASPRSLPQDGIVELQGKRGEVGAVDWAKDMLATCTDDGTVQIWRPDLKTRIKCEEAEEDSRWDWNWAI